MNRDSQMEVENQLKAFISRPNGITFYEKSQFIYFGLL